MLFALFSFLQDKNLKSIFKEFKVLEIFKDIRIAMNKLLLQKQQEIIWCNMITDMHVKMVVEEYDS